MAKFLITGATGFIGLNLAEYLTTRGHQVRALVRREPPAELTATGAEIVNGSLQDRAALKQATAGVDYIVHLAAMTAALTVQELDEANVGGTRNIAEAAANCDRPPTLIYVSSIAAAGPTGRGAVRTEAEPPAPISDYGRSKWGGENAALEFADRVPLTIVRPGIVFGPRNRALLPVLKTIKWLRFHPIPSWQPPPLSFIHVEDLNEILLRAAERGVRVSQAAGLTGPGVYNAVAPEYLDYGEFGKALRVLIRRPFAPALRMPLVAKMVAATNEGLGRLRGRADEFNFDKLRECEVESWACSPERCLQELGFTPPRTLRERFAETVDWYRRHGWL